MAYSSIADLIRAFREDERDSVAPYQWSDEQLVRFANEALVEYANETHSLFDDMSEAAVIGFAAGQQELELHPAVIDVVDACIGPRDLVIVSPGAIRRQDLPTRGQPTVLVLSTSAGAMTLYPAPTVAGALNLTVIRRPLAEVGKSDPIPDVPRDQRCHLLLHMKHKALSVPDSDLFEPSRAAQMRAEFRQACQRAYESGLRRRGALSRAVRFRW